MDDISLSFMHAEICRTLANTTASPDSWDALKLALRSPDTEASRVRYVCVTRELNQLLGRIRMLKHGGSSTLMIGDYFTVLRTRYTHLLRRFLPGFSLQCLRHFPASEPSVLLHLREPEGISSSRLTSARFPDNSVTTDPDAVICVFRSHFARMFISAHAPDPTFEDRVLDFYGSFPQVPNDFGMGLTAPTSLPELECMLRRMKTSSAAGPNDLPT